MSAPAAVPFPAIRRAERHPLRAAHSPNTLHKSKQDRMSTRTFLPFIAAALLAAAVFLIVRQTPETADSPIFPTSAPRPAARALPQHPLPDAAPARPASRSGYDARPSAAVTHGVSIPVEQPVLPVDPAAPGNTLATHGVHVAVTASRRTQDGPELSILISDAPAAAAGAAPQASADAAASAPGPHDEPAAVSATSSPEPFGLTPEQELFRTKWGWDAYARVQRAAAEDAATPH